MFGLKDDWELDVPDRYFTLEDYEGGTSRWCPGCGDLAVLTAVQRICRDEQLPPEGTVCVSGIGCSSRFPHYMKTYGFHGLHGRALPVACGIKSRRPDLKVFVATGDGDCLSIGAGHWVHAIRYNMDIVVMLFDNAIYGLTKKQTSPTSPVGLATNTHPGGAWLPPINPIQATLGLANVSFVAQTVDWNPAHLYATLKAAYDHKGTSFVRIMQRCPTYTDKVFDGMQKDPEQLLLLTGGDSPTLDDANARMFPKTREHDSRNMDDAHHVACMLNPLPLGVVWRDPTRPCYEDFTTVGMDMSVADKLTGLNREFDRFSV